MIKYYSINGKIVSKEEAVIGIDDLIVTRGYGVFDFFRVFNGKPAFIEDHLDRFQDSADELGLEIPYSREELTAKIKEVVAANEIDKCGVKVILTGGYSSTGFSPGTPNVLMMVSALPTYPASYYTNGIKLMAYQYTRETPYTKTTNYLVPIQIANEIKEAEAMDVLYHDGNYISESARSNFFIFDHNDTLITPDRDALRGITRKRVLAIAKDHFKVEERPLTLKETMAAKEAFITSSTKAIMPVRQVDFWRINKGVIGENTKKMMHLFEKHLEQYLDSYPSNIVNI